MGKAVADTSFAVDVSGLVNCSELLINGTEPSYVGGKYIKYYNDKIPTNKFTETYEESVKHHSTWTTDPSHITYVVGNVGIGTHHPHESYSLDVSGTVSIDGDILLNGTTMDPNPSVPALQDYTDTGPTWKDATIITTVASSSDAELSL